MDIFEKPMGGTEIMYQELMKRIDPSILDKFSIFNYLQDADFSKPTIFWNQLSWDQQAVEPLKDPQIVDSISHFVFVSHWQSEMYRKIYNIPGYKTHVIENASIGSGVRTPKKKKVVKLCYTSTPWRGLDVLLNSWEMASPKNAELHIFSSCHIYGKEFSKNDSQYEELYKKCENLPGVVYRGSVHNETLRKELPNFDILSYPSTFEETSCISVIDALGAGLRVVCSNLGALAETTRGYARIYPYLMDTDTHSQVFSNILSQEIESIRKNLWDPTDQIEHYSKYWSWDVRIKQWEKLLNELQPTI